MTELLTVAEVAQRLNVSECWVRRNRRQLGAIYVGRSVRFPQAVIEKLCTSSNPQFIVPVAERSLKPNQSGYQPREENMLQRNRYQRGSVFLYRGKKVKVWYGVWRIDSIGADGQLRRRQHNQRLGSIQELPTKAAAREALRALMRANTRPKAEMTLCELLEQFKQVQVPTMKESSSDYTLRKLQVPIANFGSVPISQIGRREIGSFLVKQAELYSRNTLRGFRSALSSLLGWAVECEWLTKNPCIGLKLPRNCGGRRVQRRVLTPDEVFAIVRGLHEPYATLVLFLYITGVRIGEAIAVRHEDLTDNGLHVRRRIYEGKVDEVKTERSERVLPIPQALLTRLHGLSLSGWIFQASNGQPLNPKNAMNRHVLKVARELKIVEKNVPGKATLNWHSFRHSFTVNQRRAGTHPKVLSALLGHSKVQLAMDVYDHVNIEELRQPLDQMLRSVMKSELTA